MTVASETPINNYVANGATAVFAYTFRIEDESELQVYLDDVLQVSGYSVSGVGNNGGGAVTFTANPASATDVLVVRDMPDVRITDYQNSGDFRADTVNTDFDRLWLRMQQMQRDLDYRMLQLPITASRSPSLNALPLPEYNKVLSWGSSGQLVNLDYQINVSAQPLVSVSGYDELRALSPSSFSPGAVVTVFDDGVAGQFKVVSGVGTDDNRSIISSSAWASASKYWQRLYSNELFFISVSELLKFNFKEGQIASTRSYRGTWGGGTALAAGGGQYQMTTLAQYTALTGRVSPDGYIDHLANNGLVAVFVVKDDAINLFQAGAYGDNTNYDTLAIQAILNTTVGIMIVPEATFKVTTLQLRGNLVVRGLSKIKSIIAGDGSAVVMKTGIYPAGNLLNNRNIEYRNVQITNVGMACIQQYTAVNFHITDCVVSTTNASAIVVRYSFRGIIRDCYVASTGAFISIDVQDNCNGVVVERNTVSAGSAGLVAINVGQSQAVAVRSNIIESSGELAIRVGYDSGNCNGVEISGNYVEATKRGISVGEVYTCQGVVVKNNYYAGIGVSGVVYGIRIGRVNGADISNNYIDPNSGGNGIELYYAAAGSVRYATGLNIRDNVILNATNDLAYSGTWVDAFKEALAGSSTISLYSVLTGTIRTICAMREVKVNIDTSVGLASSLVALTTFATAGGRVLRAYITNFTGAAPATNLVIGSAASVTEVYNTALNTLTFTNGFCELTLAGTRIRTTGLLVSLAASGTAKFTLNLELQY